jgi:hypothetical protein
VQDQQFQIVPSAFINTEADSDTAVLQTCSQENSKYLAIVETILVNPSIKEVGCHTKGN